MEALFFADSEAMRRIPEDVACSEMVFLGEFPHQMAEVRSFVSQIVTRLAATLDFRTVAMESFYGLHPFLEQDSMSATESKFIFSEVTRYNSQLPIDNRIMVTAIDIEHSIRHSRELTVRFLKHLFSSCSSNEAKDDLNDRVCDLLKLSEAKQIHKCLSELQDKSAIYSSTFPKEMIEELRFSLDLMHASLDYHAPESRTAQDTLPQKELNMLELRASWFRKTIERAWAKAVRRSSRLCCYVGAPHAIKTPNVGTEVIVGTNPEGYHFDALFEQIKGKVFSLLVRALAFQPLGYAVGSDVVEAHLLDHLGSSRFLYAPLRDFSELPAAWRESKYFVSGKPMYDGIVFVQ